MKRYIFAVVLLGCAVALQLTTLYETSDAGCSPCYVPTPAGSCTCPPGSDLFVGEVPLRVLNDCSGALHGGHIGVCNGTGAESVWASFGGAYQRDDPTPHSLGCRSPNPLTGLCSCPTGLTEQSFRVLVDTDVGGDFIGSTISFCVGAASGSGGMFMTDNASSACLTGNPANGNACSCASQFAASTPLRVVFPNAAGVFQHALWYTCAPSPSVEICSGVFARLDGLTDTTAQLMSCIDSTPAYGTLLLPAGMYGVATQVALRKPITIATKGVDFSDPRVCVMDTTIACVAFVALAACCTDGGILNIFSPNVVLHHVVIDGNRAARVGTTSWNECLNNDDNRGNAVNARVSGALNVSFLQSASINALCASGFQWQGDQCHIGHSYFANNGNHEDGRWADGLTLLSCQHGHVHDCLFLDNTDVNLVCGCGTGFLVENLKIRHVAAASFAGFMFDNFDNSQCGNYTGGHARNITIDCAASQCDFGANFGPHPWYASANIVGGRVSNLSVAGAKQGVNCAGAGTASAPLLLESISVSGDFGLNTFQCGLHETSAFNIDPDSVVNVVGCPAHTNFTWKSCP